MSGALLDNAGPPLASTQHDEAAAHHPAGRAARLLRRRGAGHRHRRAGAWRSTARPVYVRHEIVHNKFVVDDLKAKGAVFVEELDEIPDGDRPVVFSAHGVPKSVPAAAAARAHVPDRCHLPAGHQGAHGGAAPSRRRPRDHPHRPQGPSGSDRHHGPVAGRRRRADRDGGGCRGSARCRIPRSSPIVTQTTLSVDDTKEIVAVLQRRFPAIRGPVQGRHLLCHHQPPGGGEGDRAADRSPASWWARPIRPIRSASSKSAIKNGCPRAVLVQRASDLDWSQLQGLSTHRPHAPAPRRPKCWSTRSSMPSARITT